jgi:hypothetical protein
LAEIAAVAASSCRSGEQKGRVGEAQPVHRPGTTGWCRAVRGVAPGAQGRAGNNRPQRSTSYLNHVGIPTVNGAPAASSRRTDFRLRRPRPGTALVYLRSAPARVSALLPRFGPLRGRWG